jgi:hypothetical protein
MPPSHVLPVVGGCCRVSLAQAHAFFMFLSASSLGMGFYAIYQNKVRSDRSFKDHMYEIYGKLMIYMMIHVMYT